MWLVYLHNQFYPENPIIQLWAEDVLKVNTLTVLAKFELKREEWTLPLWRLREIYQYQRPQDALE